MVAAGLVGPHHGQELGGPGPTQVSTAALGLGVVDVGRWSWYLASCAGCACACARLARSYSRIACIALVGGYRALWPVASGCQRPSAGCVPSGPRGCCRLSSLMLSAGLSAVGVGVRCGPGTWTRRRSILSVLGCRLPIGGRWRCVVLVVGCCVAVISQITNSLNLFTISSELSRYYIIKIYRQEIKKKEKKSLDLIRSWQLPVHTSTRGGAQIPPSHPAHSSHLPGWQIDR
jgi:hypothetical protein